MGACREPGRLTSLTKIKLALFEDSLLLKKIFKKLWSYLYLYRRLNFAYQNLLTIELA
jgi:hypothetical protein